MPQSFTEAELEAYLDEALDGERMAMIEQALRGDAALLERLRRINGRRNSGVHSLAEIWRRNEVGVPSREELGSYLLGVLPPAHAEYIRFRIETLKCRFTIANLKDLEAQHAEAEGHVTARRNKYFQSSVRHLQE